MSFISRVRGSDNVVVVADTGAARGASADTNIIRLILSVLVFRATLSLYIKCEAPNNHI